MLLIQTFSPFASIETASPNFARQIRASYIRPVAIGDSEKLRTVIAVALPYVDGVFEGLVESYCDR